MSGADLKGRWRVALRYGFRDAMRNKGRTLLIALMVMIPIAMIPVMTMLYSDPAPQTVANNYLGPYLAGRVNWFSPVPIIQDPVQNVAEPVDFGLDTSIEIPVATIEQQLTETLPTGLTAVPVLQMHVMLNHGLDYYYDEVIQTDLSIPDVAAAFTLKEGRLPNPGEIVLTQAAAINLGVQIGDTVILDVSGQANGDATHSPTEFVVTGIRQLVIGAWSGSIVAAPGPIASPDIFSVENQYSSEIPALQWLIVGNQPITWDDVRALNAHGLQVFSRAVILDPPPLNQVPVLQSRISQASLGIASSQMILAVAAIVLLETILLIGPAFAVGARRSTRSLALIGANGGDRKTLSAVVLGTGVAIGIMATLSGLIIGQLIAIVAALVRRIPLSHVFFNSLTWVLPIVFVFGVLVTTLAAWLPARGAAKTDVVAALAGRRGEQATGRRWPTIVGVAIGIAGLLAAIASALAGQPLLIVAGLIAGVLGLILVCGPLVGFLGRFADRLPLSARFALRDAARHRSRTAPAIASVLVASVGATAALVYMGSSTLHSERTNVLMGQAGMFGVGTYDDEPLTPAQILLIREIIAANAPEISELSEVPLIRLRDGSFQSDLFELVTTRQPRYFGSASLPTGPVVDNGTLLPILGIPDADAAKIALSEGRIIVSPWEIDDAGMATIKIVRAEGAEPELIQVPAFAVGDPLGPDYAALPIVPPTVAADLDLPIRVTGLVGFPDQPLSAAQLENINQQLRYEFGITPSSSPRGAVQADVVQPADNLDAEALMLVALATFVALSAAWIATALAATESLPDLATMSAIGAAPSYRKRFVAAQAGTITAIGATLGVISGLAVGVAFVLYQRFAAIQSAEAFGYQDDSWSVVIPWPQILALLIAIPLLALLGSWAVTRGRETLTRRV